MDNTIYGIDCIEVDKNTVYSQIRKTINKMKETAGATRRPSTLLLTSKESFAINFESVLYDIAGHFKLTRKEYKNYKKTTGKLMKMILKFKEKEKNK